VETAERVYKDLIWQDPDRMSGVPCFYGTRVPVDDLFTFMRRGGTIDEFLDGYPTVSRELVEGVLAEGEAAVLEKVSAA
jgi:uncharacterized protein (DUF433 family)